MINNPALTLQYFQGLNKGQAVILHYNLYNKGSFIWIHDHVGPDAKSDSDEDRVWGQFQYIGDAAVVPVGSYLYVHDGLVCRGSGSEPVHLEMP